MTDEGPWQRYDRDKLPKGWAYPLGRDEVSAALVDAGVSLGSLSFSRTDPNQPADLYVLHAYWPSDARAKYFHSRDFDNSPLMMSVRSVPSELRHQIGQELKDGWLRRAVTWAGQAPKRGNAWTASDHYWNLKYKTGAGLVVEEL